MEASSNSGEWGQNPTTYTDSVKASIIKYRASEKGRGVYNDYMRRFYEDKVQDDEWRARHNERCKEYNKRYREKKRDGEEPKTRGRPRKVKELVEITEIIEPKKRGRPKKITI